MKMSNFFIDTVFSWFNNFRLKLWPNESLKRRRDSITEEEDDDIFLTCQTLRKKPKVSTPFQNSPVNMSGGSHSSQSFNRHHVFSVPIRKEKKPFYRRMDSEVKENDPDVIEVVDLDDGSETPLESRQPLSNLTIQTKYKTTPSESGQIRASSQLSHKSILEKRQSHPLLFEGFGGSLRASRTSTPKQTALNESFKSLDKMMYSRLLAQYHNPSTGTNTSAHSEFRCPSSSTLTQVMQHKRTHSLPSHKPGPSKVMEVIDLVKDKPKPKSTFLPVTPYKSAARGLDDDIKIIKDVNHPKINALERKLSQNCHVSPQWIIEMQQRYNEKEQEMRRKVEEEKLKKQFYAEHNQKKLMAATEERLRRHLRITEVVLSDTEEEEPALPEITPEMNEKINAALKSYPSEEVLAEGFGLKVKRVDIQTLNRLNWLNDEVINFYMELIMMRSKERRNINVYAFNTFFYPKLASQGHNSLRRWTKKVDIFSYDMILVPVHLKMHWCMAAIHFKDKSIRYYDSMGTDNNSCLKALQQYLNDESMDKKKTPYKTDGWKLENVKNIPQQMNGSDCGVFSCMFAEYLSRNAKFTFSQKDMPYFRRKMIYEIITKKLLL